MKLLAISCVLFFNRNMRHTLHKNNLEAVIDDHGAELVSLKANDKEIMWQAEERYWSSSSLVLFPFIGRNCSDSYIYKGKTYDIPLHGFALDRDFIVEQKEESHLRLILKEDEDSLKIYPFRFTLAVDYELTDHGLDVSFQVINDSDKMMIYDLGYHPGFALEDDLASYSVLFPEMDSIEEIGIVTRCMLNGNNKEVLLENSRMKLDPSLFTESAKIYKGSGNTAILLDRKDQAVVKIRYDGFVYRTLWQTLNSDARFLCIEGWSGLPGRYDSIENIETVETKRFLEPAQSELFKVTIEI